MSQSNRLPPSCRQPVCFISLLVFITVSYSLTAFAAPLIILEQNSITNSTMLNASQKTQAVLNISVAPASTVSYSVNNQSYTILFTNATTGATPPGQLSSLLSDGASSIRIVAVDTTVGNATNQSSPVNSTFEFTVFVDTTLPTTTVAFTPATTQPNFENIILTWTFSDNNYNGSWIALVDPNNATLINTTQQTGNTALLSGQQVQGNYTAIYFVQDNFSNKLMDKKILELKNTPPSIILVEPSNATVFNTTSALVQCKATDANLSSVAVYHTNDRDFSLVEEKPANTSQNIPFNLTNLDSEEFIWTCRAKDVHGALSFAAENRTMIIDRIKPAFSTLAPSQTFGTFNQHILFEWTVYDNLDTSIDCDLYVDGAFKKETLSGSQNKTTLNLSFGTGTHQWYLACTDNAYNTLLSETRNFTINPAEDPTVKIVTKNDKTQEQKNSAAGAGGDSDGENTQEERGDGASSTIKKATTNSGAAQRTEQTAQTLEEQASRNTTSLAQALGKKFSFKQSLSLAGIMLLLATLVLVVLGIREYSKDNILFRVKIRKYKFKLAQFYYRTIRRKKNYY